MELSSSGSDSDNEEAFLSLTRTREWILNNPYAGVPIEGVDAIEVIIIIIIEIN